MLQTNYQNDIGLFEMISDMLGKYPFTFSKIEVKK